ncbi:MAG: hypothetical protein A2W22_05440 [Candidatus Levybacteria bacterium RBG_16_35_11]|nr:MAG: hypothetical protein A2W22_05440 [Candidatus Levybacteria bacterium RBG_16_35_11]
MRAYKSIGFEVAEGNLAAENEVELGKALSYGIRILVGQKKGEIKTPEQYEEAILKLQSRLREAIIKIDQLQKNIDPVVEEKNFKEELVNIFEGKPAN